jgi:DNA-binding beta-propeller fold protein YncE
MIPASLHRSCELAINPVTNLVYIGHWTTFLGNYDCVEVYSGEDFAFVTSINVPGSNITEVIWKVGVAVNPNTNKIYLTWTGDNTVFMIDGNTHTIEQTTTFFPFDAKVSVNPYTNNVYVGKTVLNGQNLETVSTNYTGDLMAIDSVHNFLYTSDFMHVLRLNGTTHETIDEADVWVSSSDPAAVNTRSSKIYFGNSALRRVDVVNVVNSPPPTPSPSPSPSPSPKPTQTATSSPSTSYSTSSSPTLSTQTLSLPTEVIYAAVGITAIVAIAVAAVILKKRRNKIGKASIPPAPPPPPANR